MSSSRLSKTAFDLGYSGKGDLDKWLKQRVKDEDLHSSLVRELRREYSRGQSERISQDKFKAEATYLKAHKRDEKAPPIPEGEKASDQNLEYKGHLIKRTTTGWDVLGESGWGSLRDAKAYVDVYEATGGRVRRRNPDALEQRALAKLARLPKLDPSIPDAQGVERYPGDQRRAPFPGGQSPNVMDLYGEMERAAKARYGSMTRAVSDSPIQKVSLASLHGLQAGVDANIVKKKIAQIVKTDELEASTVARWRGKLYLWNGYHTTTALKMLGVKSVECVVVNL